MAPVIIGRWKSYYLVRPSGSRNSRHSTHVEVSMARIGMIVLLIVAFGGCGKQYSQPQIEPSRRPFPGIASHLLASGGNTVHVLFVHGMCTHTEREWVEGSWRPAIQAVLMAQQI